MDPTSDTELLDITFKGVQRPATKALCVDEVIAGVVFLRQLAAADEIFAMAFEDFQETVCVTRHPDRSHRNWQALAVTLFDLGYELEDETTFAILTGQLAPAAQFSNDLQRITDTTATRAVLRTAGPPVPLRERVHPFLGARVLREQQSSILTSLQPPTRIYMQDQQRFVKRRAMCVDQCEKIKEKEARLHRAQERKIKEQARAAQHNRQSHELALRAAEEDQLLQDTIVSFRADPQKLAEKQKRTLLLKELEVLESAYDTDSRRMMKLRRQTRPDSPLSPKQHAKTPQPTVQRQPQQARSAPRGRLSPIRLKSNASIPFSYEAKDAKKKAAAAAKKK
jgi:hypothetical protein